MRFSQNRVFQNGVTVAVELIYNIQYCYLNQLEIALLLHLDVGKIQIFIFSIITVR